MKRRQRESLDFLLWTVFWGAVLVLFALAACNQITPDRLDLGYSVGSGIHEFDTTNPISADSEFEGYSVTLGWDLDQYEEPKRRELPDNSPVPDATTKTGWVDNLLATLRVINDYAFAFVLLVVALFVLGFSFKKYKKSEGDKVAQG